MSAAKPHKIFVFAPVEDSDSYYGRLEAAGCELVIGKGSWISAEGGTEEELCQNAAGATGFFGATIRPNPISRRVLEIPPDLRIVSKCSIGIDDVDVEAATELGIIVSHCPTEANWGGVAESTMAMILDVLKKSRERDRYVKEGGWRDAALTGTYLGARHDGYAGITIGIIGLGRIGSRLADLLAPWRVRLLACDPYVDYSKFVHHNAERVDLDTLLAQSDVVSLHVTLSPETRHMISTRELVLMKPTALLVNTSRGPAIDEEALIAALLKDQIAGAALDVFEVEPLPLQSPLRGMGDKVLLWSHIVAMNHGSGLGPGLDWATRSLLCALRGEVPDNVYNKAVVPAWLDRFGGRDLLG